MAAVPVLVLLPLLPVGALVVLLVALLAWAVSGPLPEEPPARARLRRAATTGAATAWAAAALVVVPTLLLLCLVLLRLPAPTGGTLLSVAAAVPLVGALLWCLVLVVADVVLRPRQGVRRTARLVGGRTTPAGPTLLRTAMPVLVGVLMLLTAASATASRTLGDRTLVPGTARAGTDAGVLAPPGVLPLPLPAWQHLAVVTGLALAAWAAGALAVRHVAGRPVDAAVDPEVDASARDGLTYRLLRGTVTGATTGLGLVLLAGGLPGLAVAADLSFRWPYLASTVVGTLTVLLGLVVAFLPAPPLALRPDVAGQPADQGGRLRP